MKINITKPGIMLQILSFIISCILLISWPLFMMLFSGEGKIPFYLKILYYFGIGCSSVFILCYGITIIQLIRRRNPGIITMIPLYYFMVFYLIFFLTLRLRLYQVSRCSANTFNATGLSSNTVSDAAILCSVVGGTTLVNPGNLVMAYRTENDALNTLQYPFGLLAFGKKIVLQDYYWFPLTTHSMVHVFYGLMYRYKYEV